MAQKYYSVLTDIGVARLANAAVLGGMVNVTHFGVDDGNGAYYAPQATQTALKNEMWRGAITKYIVDENKPNQIVIAAILPHSVGGFIVRELGVFDDTGALIAVGIIADQAKVIIDEGMSTEMELEMVLYISNTDNIHFDVDPTVIIATKQDLINHNKSPKAHEELFKTIKYTTFYDLTHTLTDTVHNLTGTVPTAGLFVARFLTTAPYSVGDTFKINGTPYTVTNVNGSDLGLNCFASGVVALMACEVATSKGNLVSSDGRNVTGNMGSPGGGAFNPDTPGISGNGGSNGEHGGGVAWSDPNWDSYHDVYGRGLGQTNTVLNIIEVENGYVFDGNFDWVSSEQYGISIGCFYRESTFFEADNITEITKIPTPQELAQTQINAQQLYIEQLELQNAEQSIDTDFRLLMIENNLN